MKKFHLASDDMKRKLRKALLIGAGLFVLGASANAQNGIFDKLRKVNDKISVQYDKAARARHQVERFTYNVNQLDNVTGGIVSGVVGGIINSVAAKKARNEAAKMELQNMTYDQQENPTRRATEQSYQQERRAEQENPQVGTRQQVRVQDIKLDGVPKSGTVREITLDELVKMAQAKKANKK